jgi:hypothetical protein
MIEQVDDLITQVYKSGNTDGDYLILEEEANFGQPTKLSEVRIRLHDCSKYSVYKFDQDVHINGKHCESYAPFLSEKKGVRSMCDFVIFFSTLTQPERVNAWVVNLKSERKGNNRSQLDSGNRLTHFIFGKLQDINPTVKLGKINFLLFSSAPIYKPTINPFSSQQSPTIVGDGTLKSPKNFLKGVSPILKPL